tara:strand:+ start:138 stop:353 length:216 start_codon:yes stop_codon:yes gene_type:complete
LVVLQSELLDRAVAVEEEGRARGADEEHGQHEERGADEDPLVWNQKHYYCVLYKLNIFLLKCLTELYVCSY